MTRLTQDDVRRHISGVCFKTGPPGVVGAETEWFVVDPADPAAPVALDRLTGIMSAAGPLPGGGSLTYEPGGQLEISSAPCAGAAALHRSLTADLEHVRGRLARHGLALAGYGVDPVRPPVLQHDDARYHCMDAYFSTRCGGPGLAMMCTTASVQVCLDIGADRTDAARRWRLANALGPVLVASFANSPMRAGRRTGLKSTRQALWAAIDPQRTAPATDGGRPDEDPVEAWTRYALNARVMLARDGVGGWSADPGMTFAEWLHGTPVPDGIAPFPGLADLVYHLSTLFPPVRPQGWLELRMIDALPEPYWPVPVALATALIDDPQAAREAAAAVAPVSGRWVEAARDGLSDPGLATAARRCFEAARAALPRLGAAELLPVFDDYRARYVERGRCPADDLLAAGGSTGDQSSSDQGSSDQGSSDQSPGDQSKDCQSQDGRSKGGQSADRRIEKELTWR